MQVLRPLERGDAEAILALRLRNRPVLEPTEPDREDPEERYSLDGIRAWLARPGHGFAILDGDELAGTLGLSFLVGPPLQSGMVGYFVDSAHAGRGLATRAVGEAASFAFGELGLHRLEAGTRVDNHASQRVLEKSGFTRVGLLRRHLLIRGEWVDHVLFERLADD